MFWEVLLYGVVIGLALGMLARWIGRKLWGEKRQAIIVMCAWCGKEMRRNGIDREVIVSHGICPECRKKHFPKVKGSTRVGKEGKNARFCELLSTCPFFNDRTQNTFEMAEIYKEQYCKGNYPWCGRYMVFKTLEREKRSLGLASKSIVQNK